MIVDLDRLFGSLNLANTIINGDFSGFELVFYTNVPNKDYTDALNESHWVRLFPRNEIQRISGYLVNNLVY